MRRLCAAAAFGVLFVSSCCAQVNSPFTTYRHITDHNMSTMSAVHCSSVVLVGAGSKIVFGDGSIQTTAAGGGANAMQNPSTGTLNMSGFGVDKVAFVKAAVAFGGKSISFSNSPSGIFFDERIMPDASSSRDIGSPSFVWRNIYASSVTADGISIDALVYPRNADYPIFSMSGNNFYISQPYSSGRLHLGSTTNGVQVIGPFYAGTYGEPVVLGDVYPNADNRIIGGVSLPFNGIFVTSMTSAYFTVRSTGTRAYVPMVLPHTIFSTMDGSPRFNVVMSTMESSGNNGLLIASSTVLGSGSRGVWIDYGTDNVNYCGNVVVGELSTNNFSRPTQGRLNVKGSLYVTSGWGGEDIRFSNSASANYADFGSAGMRIRCNSIDILTAASDGSRNMPGLTATASFSLMRIDSATGRLYRDSSLRENKRDITDWEPSTSVVYMTVKSFRDAVTNQRHIGLIAEDLADAGLEELVVRDSSGALAGVAYEKVALVLIPVIHEQQERILRLERAVAALSSGTFAAEFPDGFPVGEPVTEHGGPALNLLTMLAALIMGGVGVYVGRKMK